MSTTASSAVQRTSNSEDDLVERSPRIVISKKHAPPDDRHALLPSLPSPPPFDLCIEDLSIGVPLPQHFLPLPVPIPIPSFLGTKGNDNSNKTIIRNVSITCDSGEILALCVFLAQLPAVVRLTSICCLRIGGSGSGKSTLLMAIVDRLANLPIRSG